MTERERPTRREVLKHTARGVGILGLGSAAAYLSRRAVAQGVWQIDTTRCVNSRLGMTGVEVCTRCTTSCVVPLSAVRAVNVNARCGRCCICPAYFDVTSEVGSDGLPSKKTCPRDAIKREAIGWVDPDDPFNNYYEYSIDETLCDGCGRCVMGCKEPAGLGSIYLEVRQDLCVGCNRCSIAQECPQDALERRELAPPPVAGAHPERAGEDGEGQEEVLDD